MSLSNQLMFEQLNKNDTFGLRLFCGQFMSVQEKYRFIPWMHRPQIYHIDFLPFASLTSAPFDIACKQIQIVQDMKLIGYSFNGILFISFNKSIK